jgi:hypothetical protein
MTGVMTNGSLMKLLCCITCFETLDSLSLE